MVYLGVVNGPCHKAPNLNFYTNGSAQFVNEWIHFFAPYDYIQEKLHSVDTRAMSNNLFNLHNLPCRYIRSEGVRNSIAHCTPRYLDTYGDT